MRPEDVNTMRRLEQSAREMEQAKLKILVPDARDDTLAEYDTRTPAERFDELFDRLVPLLEHSFDDSGYNYRGLVPQRILTAGEERHTYGVFFTLSDLHGMRTISAEWQYYGINREGMDDKHPDFHHIEFLARDMATGFANPNEDLYARLSNLESSFAAYQSATTAH